MAVGAAVGSGAGEGPFHENAVLPAPAALRTCSGGHGTEPYEQKTQQSPLSGFIIVPHDGHG
jgi:hypothetical protein